MSCLARRGGGLTHRRRAQSSVGPEWPAPDPRSILCKCVLPRQPLSLLPIPNTDAATLPHPGFPERRRCPGGGRLSWVVQLPFLRQGSDPATLQAGWSLKSTSEKRDGKLTAVTRHVQKRGVLEGSERHTHPAVSAGPRRQAWPACAERG